MIRRALFTSLFLGLLWGCTSAPQKEALVDYVNLNGDDPKSQTLHQGERLIVRLPATPSTGYSWVVDQGRQDLLKLDEALSGFETPQSPVRPGQSGVMVMTLIAQGVGESDLVFKYQRVWEQGVPPVKTHTLHIKSEASK
jgi:inhibitor of cysteine peptidase